MIIIGGGKMGRVKRIQFEMDEERSEELDRLMSKLGVRTRKEFFNYALSLLKWAIKERERGHRIASIAEDGNRIKEIEMPIFEAAATRVKSEGGDEEGNE